MVRHAFFAVLLAAAAVPVQADNLIQNADFDSDFTGWIAPSPPFPGTDVAFEGGDGSPSAGSARVTVDASSPTMSTGFSQCVSLAGLAPPWDFGGRLRTVSSSGSANVEIRAYFSDSACDAVAPNRISLLAAAGGTVPGVQGPFDEYALTVAKDPSPAGRPSLTVTLSVSVAATSGVTVIDADKLYIGPTGTTPVGLTGFEVR